MPDWATSITTTLITLLGTVIVAYLGFVQWRRTRSDDASADFKRKRTNAYETLWGMVEEAHIELRTEPRGLDQLRDRVTQINSFVLANEIYLSDGDHQLVNDYLDALGEMISWAENEGDAELQSRLEDTNTIPTEVTAAARAYELRDSLKQRVRAALV